MGQSVGRSVGLSVRRSVGSSVCRSVSPSVGRSVGQLSVGWPKKSVQGAANCIHNIEMYAKNFVVHNKFLEAVHSQVY